MYVTNGMHIVPLSLTRLRHSILRGRWLVEHQAFNWSQVPAPRPKGRHSAGSSSEWESFAFPPEMWMNSFVPPISLSTIPDWRVPLRSILSKVLLARCRYPKKHSILYRSGKKIPGRPHPKAFWPIRKDPSHLTRTWNNTWFSIGCIQVLGKEGTSFLLKEGFTSTFFKTIIYRWVGVGSELNRHLYETDLSRSN